MDRITFWAKVAVGGAAAIWGGITPMIQLLLILMILDIATGLLAGFVTKELSSDVSFRGVAKKAIVLLVVAAAVFGEPTTGLPLGQVVAGFYAAHELLSILENSGRAGLPVPTILQDALKKLSPQDTMEPRG